MTHPIQKKSNIFIGNIGYKYKYSFFVDASIKNGVCTIAGVCFSENEEYCNFRKKINTNNNNLAELISILECLKIINQCNISNVEIFTDSMTSLEHLRRYLSIKKFSNLFFNILCEVETELLKLEQYIIYWIPRHKNQIADSLTKI